MRTILTILTLLIITSCSFNRTYKNRESDKKDAEKITEKFYYSQTYGNPQDGINLYSEKFFAVTNREQLNLMIERSKNEYGQITEYKLKKWETFVEEGTNPKSEYLLTYDVKREKQTIQETFSLLKEDGIIRIVGYNITELY